jgi:predicted nuclease with TOPRIM domain
MTSQLDELKKEKERLEAENARLQENDVALQAELERVREESRQLQEEKETAGEATDCKRREMETLLEEQQQLHEDLQAELAEAVEHSTTLEDRCCRSARQGHRRIGDKTAESC